MCKARRVACVNNSSTVEAYKLSDTSTEELTLLRINVIQMVLSREIRSYHHYSIPTVLENSNKLKRLHIQCVYEANKKIMEKQIENLMKVV